MVCHLTHICFKQDVIIHKVEILDKSLAIWKGLMYMWSYTCTHTCKHMDCWSQEILYIFKVFLLGDAVLTYPHKDILSHYKFRLLYRTVHSVIDWRTVYLFFLLRLTHSGPLNLWSWLHQFLVKMVPFKAYLWHWIKPLQTVFLFISPDLKKNI